MRLLNAQDWQEGAYGKWVGCAELYKPGGELDGPTRMARSYFILAMKEVAPEVLADLRLLLIPYGQALDLAIERFNIEKAEAKKIGKNLPYHAPRASSVYETYERYCNGRQDEIASYCPVLLEFLHKLHSWSTKHNLPIWVVKECLPALDEERDKYFDLPFGYHVGYPSQSGSYRLPPDRIEYRYSQYGGEVGERPEPVATSGLSRGTSSDGEEAVADQYLLPPPSGIRLSLRRIQPNNGDQRSV